MSLLLSQKEFKELISIHYYNWSSIQSPIKGRNLPVVVQGKWYGSLHLLILRRKFRELHLNEKSSTAVTLKCFELRILCFPLLVTSVTRFLLMQLPIRSYPTCALCFPTLLMLVRQAACYLVLGSMFEAFTTSASVPSSVVQIESYSVFFLDLPFFTR